jgi:hypothetical protein
LHVPGLTGRERDLRFSSGGLAPLPHAFADYAEDDWRSGGRHGDQNSATEERL